MKDVRLIDEKYYRERERLIYLSSLKDSCIDIESELYRLERQYKDEVRYVMMLSKMINHVPSPEEIRMKNRAHKIDSILL